MKKIFLRMAVVILLIVVFSLPACSTCATNNESINNDEMLSVVTTQWINNGHYVTIVYDSNTLVMYALTFGAGGSSPSALLPLYNADGTLKLYTPSNSNK